MTESTPTSPAQPTSPPSLPNAGVPTVRQDAMIPASAPYAAAHAAYGTAPVGKIRSTGTCILLAIVTFGIYAWVWFYQTHSEMKRHSGQGLDGGLALVLTIFVGFVMPYITASEVGNLYERRGQRKPVSGVTGLWYFPGSFIVIGPLIWFVKTNGALNAYWRSIGAA